ncbi:unnamed protein product [Phytophthora fragariaefolia]|uniref:Unnamed protein product n=1 Tax=Phytophthora fragariaefolia TaxID=1490495 RepID=A0A9W7CJX2_9STRA|nr:unnamed protein product [Phytophthora fragariaefolia]
MPDEAISIQASGLAIVVKLWRQFTRRAVGRPEHSDLDFALWERTTGFRLLLSSNGSSGSLTESDRPRPSIWRRRQRGGLTTKLGTRGSRFLSGSGSGVLRMLAARSSVRRKYCWSLRCCNTSSRPSFGLRGSTREEIGTGIVVNPVLSGPTSLRRGSKRFLTRELKRPQMPPQLLTHRPMIPAADQADVQAELGATAAAQARLDVLAGLAMTAQN